MERVMKEIYAKAIFQNVNINQKLIEIMQMIGPTAENWLFN
jgi:hypothetical protein